MTPQRIGPRLSALVLFVFAVGATSAGGHEPTGITFLLQQGDVGQYDGPRMFLGVTDQETGEPTAARFSLLVDGEAYYPQALGRHGLRFLSIHERKKQRFLVTYTRGTGVVEIPLPPGAGEVEVHVAKGFDYLPTVVSGGVGKVPLRLDISLRRWNDVQQRGWLPADEHVHYDRVDPELDRHWLTMMAGDDLAHAHFMVLKGANIDGVWARQFAYGVQGEAVDSRHMIRPGEEYRDTSQGHINLLGVGEVIPPISTGGLGTPTVPYNYPPLYDVFRRARELGGLGGVAHGASGRSTTAVADTVLGAVDFFEIGNTHLYKLDVWYSLMNCGFILPPLAGTDLPNFPFRDRWQPFLGEIRSYVKVGEDRSFTAWKQAVKRGEVFVSSGPIITLTAGGVGPGHTLRLPPGGGEVAVMAELTSPVGLESLEIVQSGRPLGINSVAATEGPVHRLRIEDRLRISQSCWIAARGVGVPLESLAQRANVQQNAVAHTAAIRVVVGDEPIRSPGDAAKLIEHLRKMQEYYRTQGKYQRPAHRDHALRLFDDAVAVLRRQSGD